jgi:hypothetical protein
MTHGEPEMLQSLMMFFAPAAAQTQATNHSSLAPREAERRPAPYWKMALSVIGNAAGFLALLAGCWLMLQVLLAFLQP